MISGVQETTTAFRVQLLDRLPLPHRRALGSVAAAAVELGKRGVIVDCVSWRDLDLVVLSALVHCASRCDEQGLEFELENLSAEMRVRIRALGLSDRLRLD